MEDRKLNDDTGAISARLPYEPPTLVAYDQAGITKGGIVLVTGFDKTTGAFGTNYKAS